MNVGLMACLAVLAGSAILLTACPKIPIQTARVDSVLHYTQTYDLSTLRRSEPSGETLGPALISAVIGEDNYCCVSETAQQDMVSELFDDEVSGWSVRGMATAIVSPSPWFTDGFFVEAHGRYVVRNAQALIATSDFYVSDQSSFDIKDLFAPSRDVDRGSGLALRWIDLLFEQMVVREIELGFYRKRFVFPSRVVVRLYILPLSADGVFTIAPIRHEIGIVSPLDPDSVYSVGCLEFDGPFDGRKMFDVRDRHSSFRRTDYGELLNNAGIRENSRYFHPRWYGKPCAAELKGSPFERAAGRSASDWNTDDRADIFRRLFPAPKCDGIAPTSPRCQDVQE